jgi:PKD repeat protein
MPSAAMNAAGDIGIGYLLSSTKTFVSTAAMGQTASASGSGTLDTEELICAPGGGVQEDVARAGDYSSTSVDPLDDSFWHTNEVFTETGSFQWDTFVCEFVVASNGVNNPPVASFDYTCDELNCTFTDGSTDSDGSVVAWSWAFDDGSSSTSQNPSHTFAADGNYEVTLWVTDNENATDSAIDTVSVSSSAVNVPPTASFTYSCVDLACTFDGGGSSDSDGTIASYAWNFGDTATASGQTPSHAYAADGDYNVTLTVTDNLGAVDSDNQLVTVSGGADLLLEGTAVTTSSNRWMASVKDLNGSELHGSWSASGAAVCTGSVCTLSNIHKKVLSVTFTADGSGEQITIDKP